ncbi:PKD domain-containing protein [Marinoscillum pacificum]|uniref:PKD domain-containing protein n=1 Tax=Marinoscillum pacificum TaxID=392723 RepID=UPI0021587FC3|nr:PKD domain-containing protein [Marinoscillum pacificum]
MTVLAQPTVNWTASPTCVDSEMVFSNSSTANGSPIASYAWDFGDGEGSAVRNPIHTFDATGNYNVKLTVIDDNGDRATLTQSVTVHPKASTSFNITTTNHCVGISQSFDNISTIGSGSISSNSWSFGDGSSSTLTDPTHTYTSAGTYTVTLTTTSNNGCVESFSRELTIYPNPVADFVIPTSACLGETVSFTNNSFIESGSLNYSWNFGDGSGLSTEINPTHTYASAGTYSVTLTVTSESGSCPSQITKPITIHPVPQVDFTFSDICIGETALFTNNSTISSGTMSHAWTFGDGVSSTLASPSHTYDNPGSYQVKLTVTSNNGCIETLTKELNVSPLPTAEYEAVTEVCLGDAVDFTSLSTAVSGGLVHSWSFGDGNSSPLVNPSHTYSSSGLYTVLLNVESDFGCEDTYSTQVRVHPVSVGGSVSGTTTRCADDDVTYTLNLTGQTGDVIRWERSLTGVDQWVSIDNTLTSLDYSDLQETTYFRAIVKSGICDEAPSSSARIQIDELSDGGVLSGSKEVCFGTNSTLLELSDYNGVINDWEFATDPSGPWNTLGVNSTSFIATNLSTTTYYRVEVINGVCSPDYSSIATVTVTPETVGGSVSGGITRCADDDAVYTLTLSGHVGSVVRWERSLTDVDQWVSIANTTTTLEYSDLQETTYFRAIVQNGVCEEEASLSAEIQIDDLSEGGELSGSTDVCSGTNTTELKLSNFTGDIENWESAPDPTGPWTGLGTTTSSFFATDLTVTTYYRVEVKNGECGSDYSSIATVNVIPETVGGSVSGTTTRCADDDATYTLTLSGHTGEVIRWERSLTGNDQWSSINVTTTSINYSDLQETTYFRAVVKSGVCDEQPSTSARIQIDELSDGGELAGSTDVCSGANSTELEVINYIGVIEDWESAPSQSGPWTGLGVTTETYSPTNLTSTTFYRVKVQNGVCSPDYSSIAGVTVIPGTVGGTVDGTITRCADDDATYTLTLSGHVGDVIRWERSLTGTNQWTSIDITVPTLDYSDLRETTYFRAIVQSGGCDALPSSSARIQIDELSQGGEVEGSSEVCSGSNATVLDLNYYYGDVIDWESSSDPEGPWVGLGVTSDTYTASNLNSTTYYRALVQNGVCSVDSSTVASVVVIPETDAGILSGNATVCQGDNSGQITLSGIVGNVVRWEFSLTGQQPWAPINLTTTTLDYDNLEQSTWYRAVVQSGVCDAEISNVVEITVDTPTDPGTITGVDEVCAELNSGTLTLEGYNGSILKWQTSSDNTTWIDVSNITDELTFTNLISSTYYRAQVQNGVCTVLESESFFVQVNALPVVDFSAAEVCDGTQSVFVNNTAVSGGVISGYEWYFDDGESSTISNPGHTYSSYGTYAVKLVAESTAGCIDSLTRDVTVNPNPVAGFSQSDVCLDVPMDFSNLSTVALGTIDSYNWDLDDGTTQTEADFSYDYATDGEYRVELEVITDKGCSDQVTKQVEVFPLPTTTFTSIDVCFGETTTFANNSGITSGTVTYAWNFGDGNTSPAVNPTHNYEESGAYSVNLETTSNQSCQTDYTLIVNVFEQPVADFSFENICRNETAVFTNNSTGNDLSYLWNFGDGESSDVVSPSHDFEAAGLYEVTLTIENESGCNSEVSKTIRVAPMPVVAFEMEDVCLEESVSFVNYSTVASGSLEYLWLFDDGNQSTEFGPDHIYVEDGKYAVSLTATSNHGCVVELTEEVVIHPLPVPDFVAEAVCDGFMTYFIDQSSINSGSIESYLWDFGDQSNSILPNPEHQYLNPGSYDAVLKLTSEFGCKRDTTKEVIIYDFPVANFSVENVCFGFEITAENSSQIANGSMTYHWDFGDGQTSTSKDPSYLYDAPGFYDITLTATSGNNCIDVITRTVEIYATPEVSAGEDTSVSQGYTVQLVAEGGVRYSWYPLEGLDHSNVFNPIARPLTTTDYEVTVTDQFGCRNKDTVRVNVIEDFKIVANNVFTPDDNGQNDTWVINNVETFGDVNVRVYDRYGSLVFQEEAYENDWKGTSGSDILPDGTYFYVITFSRSDRKYQGALTIIRNK